MRDDTIDVTNSILVGMMRRVGEGRCVVFKSMNLPRSRGYNTGSAVLWTGRARGPAGGMEGCVGSDNEHWNR